MKKLLILLVMLVLVSSFAIAEADNANSDVNKSMPVLLDAQAKGMPNEAPGNGSLEQVQAQEQTQLKDGSVHAPGSEGLIQTKTQMKGQSGVQAGLDNAMTRVKNEGAKAVFEQNMNKFTEQYQNRIANMNNVEVKVDEETGAAMIKAKEDAKFLGLFKVQKTKTFELSADGVVKEKKSFFNFMYSKAKTEIVE